MNVKDWLKYKNLEYINGKLMFKGHDVQELGEKHGTPLYISSQDVIVEKYRTLKNALEKEHDKVRIYYAVKANSNPAILKILNDQGACADCVSIGEIQHCLNAGFDPSKILYTGNNQTEEQLKFALDHGVNINLDAISQIKKLRSMIKNNEKLPLISFRVNPEIGAGHHDHCITAGQNVKFGILDNSIIDAYKNAIDAGFKRFGIQMHIGSGILNIEPFESAAERFMQIIGDIKKKLNIKFEFIDFGGGIGIPYRTEEKPLDINSYAKSMINIFKKGCKEHELGDPYFCIEPGRYIVCESTILLVQVNTIKATPYKNFAGVNAGFNTLIRPAMYGSYHHVIQCRRNQDAKEKRYEIVGQICESGDVLARDRKLKELKEKDYLAILDTGAYGFTMASEYNSNPLPAEVLLHEDKVSLMRERQSFDDLLRHVVTPDWLK
ncbi:MAG: diaminopimelate decarboxylase [Promethearchaeota archaeon]